MKAFTATIHTKKTAVSLAMLHLKQENYIQGTFQEGKKGCSVGCMTMAYVKKNPTTDWHVATEPLFGIPRTLSRMQDWIFEGLSVEESKKWTPRFFKAINSGADLSMAVPKLMLWILTDPEGIRKHARPATLKIIEDVAKLYTKKINSLEPERSEWLSIFYVAVAADAAAAAAAADDVADAADAAAAAAAALAGRYWRGNYFYGIYRDRPKAKAYFLRMADALIEILKETK